MSAIVKTSDIPFNIPYVSEAAEGYVRDALRGGKHCGNGKYGKLSSEALQRWSGAAKVFLTPSCTAALEMSALLLDIQPGDEVIVPSFTFVSTPCAYAIFGAKPVFVDVDPHTLNLDVTALKAALGPRTKAIVPVHYGGVACPMEEILEVARSAGAAVIEDNAHGLFASYQGKPLGSFGAASTLSFHETKNCGCGEGGALVVNDPQLVARTEIMQEKGTDRSRFLLGQVDKYTWVDRGSSYLLGELPAALLYANLCEQEQVQARRLKIWEVYHRDLADWALRRGITRPGLVQGSDHPAHLYYLLMPDGAQRQAFTAHLKSHGIQAAFHYQPLHLSPMGLKLGGFPGQCPVTESVAERLVRLPLYATLRPEEQERIIEAALEWK